MLIPYVQTWMRHPVHFSYYNVILYYLFFHNKIIDEWIHNSQWLWFVRDYRGQQVNIKYVYNVKVVLVSQKMSSVSQSQQKISE